MQFAKFELRAGSMTEEPDKLRGACAHRPPHFSRQD
jgi:hypothetical protein